MATRSLAILVFALFWISCALPRSTARAQESTVDDKKAVVVATTNIFNAAVTGQDRTLAISFDLNNRTGAQPEVRYFVELRERTQQGSGAVVDQHTYSDTLSLRAGDTKHVQVTYAVPPSVPAGSYDVWVKAAQGSGLLLALANAGTVSVTSASTFPAIAPGSCSLSVAGDAKTYTPEQGVDIAPSETLTATCAVISEAAQTVMPHFVVRYRSSVGDVVSETTDTNSRTTLTAGKQQITVTLPPITKPQAYEVLFSLADDSGTRSNDVPLHLVVQGESATIQNIVLDRDRYAAGDTAQLSFYWTASADTFADSRIGTGTVVTAPSVSIRVTSSNGADCAAPTIRELAGQANTQTFTLPITAPCENPTAHVSLASQSGVLDTKSLAVESAPNPADTTTQTTNVADLAVKVLVALSALAALTAFGLYLRRQHTTPPTAPTALLLVLLAASLFGAGEVRADTFTVPAETGPAYMFFKSVAPPDFTADNVGFHWDWPHPQWTHNLGMWMYKDAFSIELTAAEVDLLTEGLPSCTTRACNGLKGRIQALTLHSSSRVYDGIPSSPIPTDASAAYIVLGSGAGIYSGETTRGPTTVDHSYQDSVYTVSIDKSTYAPGEAIVATYSMQAGQCANGGGTYGQLTAQNAGSEWRALMAGEDAAFSSNFTAPTTPGSYTFDYYGTGYVGHFGAGRMVKHPISYTVACPTGQTWNGTSCVATTYACTGDIPHSVPCPQDDIDLTADTPKTVVAACSAPEGSQPKCEVTCATGFQLQDTVCVSIPPSAPQPTALIQFIDSNGTANPTSPVDPMLERTWKWESTNAQIASAQVALSECDDPMYDSPSSNWTPWNATIGLKPGSTATSGEQTAIPGETRYGCRADFSYTATNTASNLDATSRGTMRFASRIPNAPSVELTADQTTVLSGERPKLSWTSTNVTSCTASANPTASTWNGAKPLQGIHVEQSSITAATTYHITCTGTTGGTANDEVTISVTAVAATPALAVCPPVSAVDVGESVQLHAYYKADHDNGSMTCAQATTNGATNGVTNVTNDAVWTTGGGNVTLSASTKGLVTGVSPTTGLGAQIQARYTTGGSSLSDIGYVSVRVPGVCGSSAGGTYDEAPTTNLCQSGTPTVATLNATGDAYAWSCGTTSCTANHTTGSPQ